MISKFASILPDEKSSSERIGTVVSKSGGSVTVLPVGSSSVLPNIQLVGYASIGDEVVIQKTGNKRIAVAKDSTVVTTYSSFGSTGSGGASQDLTSINSAIAALSSIEYLVSSSNSQVPNAKTPSSGNLITIQPSGGSVLFSVDSTKLTISGGKLDKSGAGTLTLSAPGNYTAVIPASGTMAVGAGTLSVTTGNNTAISGHTHAITSSSYVTGSVLLSSDSSGRLGLQGLGIGIAGQSGYAIYSSSLSPSYLSGPLGIGAAATTTNPFRIGLYGSDAFLKPVRVSVTRTSTVSQTNYTQALHLEVVPQVNAGVTDSGYHAGFYSEILRFSGSDTGTLGGLYGGFFSVGHYGTVARTTTFVNGFSLALYAQGGTINDSRLLWLQQIGSVNPTGTNFGLFADAAGMNHFVQGDFRIGTAAASAKLSVESTTEQLRVAYNASTYWKYVIDSSNNLTITPVPSTGKMAIIADLGVGGAVPAGQTADLRLINGSQYVDINMNSSGDVQFNNQSSTGYGLFRFNNGLASSSTFASGFTGSGWRIDQFTPGVAAAEFDQLTVRGRMRVYELLISQIRATNGNIFISDVAKIAFMVTSPATYGSTCKMEISDSLVVPFAVNDLIRAQKFTGNSVYQCNMRVTALSTDGIAKRFTAEWVSGDLPTKDMDFVRIGNTTDTTRQGAIYMASSDNNAPYLEILDGVSSFSEWGGYSKLKARLGKLTGISDQQWGTLAGYGLYVGNNTGNNYTSPYFYAGTLGVKIRNAEFTMWSGSDITVYMNPATPSIALGSGANNIGILTGNGIWMGNHFGSYKFRVGSVAASAMVNGILWDGANLSIHNGSLYVAVSGTQKITLDAANRQLRIGADSGAMSILTGNGIWMGDAGGGVYMLRIGSVDGTNVTNGLIYDGTNFGINGASLVVANAGTPILYINPTTHSLAVGANAQSITYDAGGDGFWAGRYGSTYRVRIGSTSKYLAWDSSNLMLYGAGLTMFDGSVNGIYMSASAPSLAIGSAAESITYASGTGFWAGRDSGAYKMRIGGPSGNGMFWNGTSLSVIGNVSVGQNLTSNYGINIGKALFVLRFNGHSSGHRGQATTNNQAAYGPPKFGKSSFLSRRNQANIAAPSIDTDFGSMFGWALTQNGSSTATITNETAATGETCAKMVRSGGQYNYLGSSLIAVSPNTQYTVSVWAKKPRGSGIERIWIWQYNSVVAYLGGAYDANAGTSSGPTDWELLTATFTTAPTAAYVVAALTASASADTIIYWDSFSITQTPFGPGYSSTTYPTSLVYKTDKNFTAQRFSIGMWIAAYGAQKTGGGYLFTTYTTWSSNSVYIRLNDSNQVVCAINDSGPTTPSQILPFGKYKHVVCTYDGGTIRIYIDGALAGSAAATGNCTPGATFRVGGWGGGDGYEFDGLIDDFFITDRVLSDSEISAIYQSNAPVQVGENANSLFLYDNNNQGMVVANATGIFGYSSNAATSGSGSFALVTTTGTVFDGQSMNAGDLMLGNATSDKSNLYYDRNAGRLRLRKGTLDRIVINTDGALGIKAANGTDNVLLFHSGGSEITGNLSLTGSGSIRAGGDVVMDANGFRLAAPTTYADRNSILWTNNFAIVTNVYSLVDSGSTNTTLVMRAYPPAGGNRSYVDIGASVGSFSSVRVYLQGTYLSGLCPGVFKEFKASSGALAGGIAEVSTDALGATAITITQNGTVTAMARVEIVVKASNSATPQALTANIALGGVQYFTFTTTNEFYVSVSAGGSLYMGRNAGSATYRVTLKAVYI